MINLDDYFLVNDYILSLYKFGIINNDCLIKCKLLQAKETVHESFTQKY